MLSERRGKLNFFDFHCDTAGECFNRKLHLHDSPLQLSLCKGEILDKWAQLFAIWIPDELRGEAAEKYYKNVRDYFLEEIEMNSSKIKLCKGLNDFNDALEAGKCAAFLTVEGASALCAEGALQAAKQDGVKLITLTWNDDNELASGCQSAYPHGFTQAGKRFLTELKELNIVADVSHLSRESFSDLVSMDYDGPVIASHSDSAEVLLATREKSEDRFFSERRALNDEQAKYIIGRGGLIGINFCNSFLGDPGDDGAEAVYRHISRFLYLGGENSVAVGSDFDGCDISPDMDSVGKIPALRDYLSGRGMSDGLLEKIFFENSAHFFSNILQNEQSVL